MPKDVTKPSTMIELQGDIVRVVPDQVLLTIIQIVDTKRRSLALVDKSEKTKTSYGELTQAMFDKMIPVTDKKDPRIKWELTL